MPNLNFILPHWMYWGTLILFPLIAMYLVQRQRRLGVPRTSSVFIAYMFWVTGGFMGLHRLYLRSYWGFLFVPLFLGILYVNTDIRDAREDMSRTRSELEHAHNQVNRAHPPRGTEPTPEQRERLAKAEAEESTAKTAYTAAVDEYDFYFAITRWLAIAILILMIIDAILIPGLVRRLKMQEANAPHTGPPEVAPPDVPPIGTHEDPTLAVHTRVTDWIDALNTRVGEFVAYWAVISVFVYYYEVIARFWFNSPTNWVHESMFLMYGMQYMLSGAYAYKEDQHVRVDVIYTQFSPRGKAIADIITSVFFFIFIGTMVWTGWKFASDAVSFGEVSFTEWAVQYWPVKLTIPIGAALLLLQGIAKLIKDIAFLANSRGA
jgi:TRAP-type mannitol/chloroaromatic compound transport system permease small subunit